MTELADWLVRTLPTESGPLCSWLAGHWDTVQPVLVAVFLSVLAAELAAVRWLAE